MRRKFSSFYDGSRLLTWGYCRHLTRCGFAREICRGFSLPGMDGQAQQCSSRAHKKVCAEELKRWIPFSRVATPSRMRRVLSNEVCLSTKSKGSSGGKGSLTRGCNQKFVEVEWIGCWVGWMLASMHRNLVLLSASPQTANLATVDHERGPIYITCLECA